MRPVRDGEPGGRALPHVEPHRDRDPLHVLVVKDGQVFEDRRGRGDVLPAAEAEHLPPDRIVVIRGGESAAGKYRL